MQNSYLVQPYNQVEKTIIKVFYLSLLIKSLKMFLYIQIMQISLT